MGETTAASSASSASLASSVSPVREGCDTTTTRGPTRLGRRERPAPSMPGEGRDTNNMLVFFFFTLHTVLTKKKKKKKKETLGRRTFSSVRGRLIRQIYCGAPSTFIRHIFRVRHVQEGLGGAERGRRGRRRRRRGRRGRPGPGRPDPSVSKGLIFCRETLFSCPRRIFNTAHSCLNECRMRRRRRRRSRRDFLFSTHIHALKYSIFCLQK